MTAILKHDKTNDSPSQSKSNREFQPLYPELQTSKFYLSPIFHSFVISTAALCVMLYCIWSEFTAKSSSDCWNDLRLGVYQMQSGRYCNQWLTIDEVKKILKIPKTSICPDHTILSGKGNHNLIKSLNFLNMDENTEHSTKIPKHSHKGVITSTEKPSNKDEGTKGPIRDENEADVIITQSTTTIADEGLPQLIGQHSKSEPTPVPHSSTKPPLPPPIEPPVPSPSIKPLLPPPIQPPVPSPSIKPPLLPPIEPPVHPPSIKPLPPPIHSPARPFTPLEDAKSELTVSIKIYDINLRLNINSGAASPSYEATVKYMFNFSRCLGEQFYLDANDHLDVSIDKQKEQVEDYRHEKGNRKLMIKFRNSKYSPNPCHISTKIKVMSKVPSIGLGFSYFHMNTFQRNVLADFSNDALSNFIPCFDSPEKRAIFKLKINLDTNRNEYYTIGETEDNNDCNVEQIISPNQFSFAVLHKTSFHTREFKLMKCNLKAYFTNKDTKPQLFNIDKITKFYKISQSIVDLILPAEEDLHLIIIPKRKSNPSVNWRVCIIDWDTASYDWKDSNFLPAVILAQMSFSISLFHSFYLVNHSDKWLFQGCTIYLGITMLDSSDLFKKMVDFYVLISDKNYIDALDHKQLRRNLHIALLFNDLHYKIPGFYDFVKNLFKSNNRLSSKMVKSLVVKAANYSIDLNNLLCRKVFYENIVTSMNTRIKGYILFNLKKVGNNPGVKCSDLTEFSVKLHCSTDKTQQEKLVVVREINNLMIPGSKILTFNFLKISEADNYEIVYEESLFSKFINTTFSQAVKLKSIDAFIEEMQSKLINSANYNPAPLSTDLHQMKNYETCRTLNYIRKHVSDKTTFKTFMTKTSIPSISEKLTFNNVLKKYSLQMIEEECRRLNN